METFDVVVIGSGPGGYVSAIRAAQLGLKVAIVERKALGGVCLNIGCIPSKALLRNAELVYFMRTQSADFGIQAENLTFDYSAAYKRSRQTSERLTKGVSFLLKKNNITVVEGHGEIANPGEVLVRTVDGRMQTLSTRNVVLATGAHPTVIPGMEPDGEKILDYEDAILLQELPKSAVIIGAGAVGVEFATVWSAYGVEVHIVEMLPHILPAEDDEAAAELSKAFRKRGVKIHAGTKVQSVQKTENGVEVQIAGEKGEEKITAEAVLVAVGFKPNSTNIGLEKVGVAVDPRGFVQIDERMATNIPGIWAIGDVTGKLLLAHTASTMGIICAEAIAGLPARKLDYRMIPRATYTQPQVASFGYTEKQAQEAGYNVRTGKFPFMANGKALGYGESAGYIKIVIDENNNQLLGASLVGADVSELLPELTLAQANGLPVEAITQNIHAHPTLSEVLMEAAEAAVGHAIHL